LDLFRRSQPPVIAGFLSDFAGLVSEQYRV
jgi:hypothetical protein